MLERYGLVVTTGDKRLQAIKKKVQKTNQPRQSDGFKTAFLFTGAYKKLEFLKIDPRDFIRIANVVIVSLSIGLGVLSGKAYLIPINLLLITGLTLYWVDRQYRKKVQEFESFLEDSIQSLISSLQAGLNLIQAFEVVAAGQRNMASEVFEKVLDEYRVGVSMQSSLRNVQKQIDSNDFDFLSETIDIFYISGGDITEILDSLLAMIRRKKSQRGDLIAKTAEVRLTANMLILLPIVLLTYLGVYQKEMIEPLFTSQAGLLVLSFGVLLWVVGVFIVKRFTNIHTIE